MATSKTYASMHNRPPEKPSIGAVPIARRIDFPNTHSLFCLPTTFESHAESVPDAFRIADQLQGKGVKLALGRNIHDPSAPMGKLFFNMLGTSAEFDANLIRIRTRAGERASSAPRASWEADGPGSPKSTKCHLQ